MGSVVRQAEDYVLGHRDLVGGARDADWVVGAWFTPDYAHWCVPFRASLERVGAPYHILARERIGSGWASETMQKPQVVRRLLDLNPGKTLVLLDIDCQVRKCPSQLLATINGDVAAYIRAKRSGRGKDRARIKVMSGTMVFRPTPGARRLLDAWEAAAAECDADDVDQTSLMIALGRATDFTFQPVGPQWCDFEGLHPEPAIVHDHASAAMPRQNWLQRGWTHLARRLAALSPPIGDAPRRPIPSPSQPIGR